MKKLNILFNTSPGSFRAAGGGEIQLLETKKELEELGHNVKILEREKYKVDFKDFDIFHNFNIHRDNYGFVSKAKEKGLPIAISTIYWPSMKSVLLWNKGTKKFKAVGAELAKRIDFLEISKVRKMVKMADMLLPNSKAEAAILKKIFSVEEEKIFVVPNGVDKRFGKAKPGMFAERFGLKDFVLYVGRIEERKNVLGLIKAMNSIEEKLVIIGDTIPGSTGYLQKCIRQASKNIVFLKPMQHNSKLLESAYAASKVFCLPSWYETPGLAALEAGLAGANLVVTEEGSTREYFKDFALYAKPNSAEDIKEKILLALERNKSKQLSIYIAKNFFWKNAAKETVKAYKKILRG